MTELIDLPAVPPVLPSFFKAAFSGTRRPKGVPVLPDWELRVRALRVERKRLAAYSKLCGLPDSEQLPILYPQVLATPLFLHLMTRPGFPLPLLGLVHVRNEIEQQRPLTADESLDMRLKLGEGRQVKAGFEFDLLFECAPVDGEPVWRGKMTVIHRARKRPDREKPKAPPPVEPHLAEYLALEAAEDVGRRYAAISQDYNPIHLHAASARLFGFPRAIAHGLWTAARCLALVQGKLGHAPRAYAVQFKQPLLLPGRAALRLAAAPDHVDFALLAARSDKVHLTGTLR